MEKNKKEFRKYIILIVVAIITYWIINNLSLVGNVLKNIFNIIFPFVLGGCLAFILNMPMTFFEKKLLKNKNPKSKKNKKATNKKLVRIISIIFAIIVILMIFALIINLIVPELINIVNLLIDNMPYYLEELTKFLKTYEINISNITNMIQESNIDIDAIKGQITTLIPSIVTSSISIVSGVINAIATFFISIVFAIYILMDKEKLGEQGRKILLAYLTKEKLHRVMEIGKVINNTFKSFFTVQCLEAMILGTLCCIGMLILDIPYAVPIGILIGVTALVPIVGAFLGVIIGAILIIAVNPVKVITFVIFVLILQQIEGNFIYPRIVGSKIGLPGMWVLLAVSVGGKLGGVLGMLLGVPVATIIYTLLKNDVNEKIENKSEK